MQTNAKKWTFQADNLESLRRLCEQLNCSLPVCDEVSILAEPVACGDLLIPNALAVHPMEGADGDAQGRPGPLTLRRYERFAAGGAGLLWAEAIAVTPEGRANPRQLWLHEDNKADFAELVERIRRVAADSMGPDHRPVLVAQLTHSGRYSNPEGTPAPVLPQHDPYRDPMRPEPTPTTGRHGGIPADWPLVTDDELDQLQDAFVAAARLAFEVGFDAVDIKACHGYLIHELLASRHRPGKYGGPFENRIRFLLEVIDRIHLHCGLHAAIAVRLNFYDAIPYPYGWGVDKRDYRHPDLTEPNRLVGLLLQRGVRLLNFTLAIPGCNPHLARPFNRPIRGGYPQPEHPLIGVHRLISLAGQVQQAFPDLTLVGSGYSWLEHLMGHVAAAAVADGRIRSVGAGRMALAYPDFAKDLLTKGVLDRKKVCVACSACTQLMRDGQPTGCVIRDGDVYKLSNRRP